MLPPKASLLPANDDAPWFTAREKLLSEIGFKLQTVEYPLVTMAGGSIVSVTTKTKQWELFVSDEFRDLETGSQSCQAELVIKSCAACLSASSAQDWLTSEGVPPRCHLPLKLRWADDKIAALEILELLSPISDQITDVEWALNIGRAQQLRAGAKN